MPSRMQRYNSDPNGLGRGPGYYYLRGGKSSGKYKLPSGRVIKGPYYSKYSIERDMNILSFGSNINKVGFPPERVLAYGHTGDGDLNDSSKNRRPAHKRKKKS